VDPVLLRQYQHDADGYERAHKGRAGLTDHIESALQLHVTHSVCDAVMICSTLGRGVASGPGQHVCAGSAATSGQYEW